MEPCESQSSIASKAAAHFHIPEGIYLLSHSVGCLPKCASSAPFFSSWAERGGDAWPLWLESLERFREALAILLGGRSSEFCPQANLSSALTKILGSLPKREGRTKLLLSRNSFPSIGFVMQQCPGYQIGWLEEESPGRDTQLVLFTHVYSNSGEKATITSQAKEAGAFVALDIAQSAGVVPLNLPSLPIDFAIGSCVKWLCGGPGAGFLWCRSDQIEQLHPIDVGWFSHENPFQFEIDHFRYAQDALRFWGGTPSILPYQIATQSINTLFDIGIEAIRDHNRALTERIISALDLQPPMFRGGTITLSHTEQREQALKDLDVATDIRQPHGFRLSPHIYNTAEEIDQLIAALT